MISHNLIDRNSGRNYGIDLLRIVAMVMIPLLHVLGHGGILGTLTPLEIHYEIAWFLEIACYCAVNVYALISGYVGYGRKQKYANLIQLSFQVASYTILTTIVVRLICPNTVDWKTFLKAFFPWPFGVYWYFTAYMCLFLFMPYINLILDTLKKETMQRLLIISGLVFFGVPYVIHARSE